MADGFELRRLRLTEDLRARLAAVREPRKAVHAGLRAALELFAAPEGAIATLDPARSGAETIHLTPGSTWDERLLADYLLGRRPPIPEHTLLAPVERRERNWAVLAVRSRERSFTDEELRAFFAIAQVVTESLARLDELRTREVRSRIEHKIAERRVPKDLMYDILHGLRSLTGYNHSGSLWIATAAGGPLELVAEQIAWTKARSKRIGQRLELDAACAAELERDGVHLFERSTSTGGAAGRWAPRAPLSPAWLPAALDYAATSGEDVPSETHMVCAPMATPDGTLGVLKISSREPGILGPYEAGLVEDFMPLASLAVQFSVRAEAFEARMLQAERKHGLADLSRGIAHDVNNALGAMLPLVQQLREDLVRERLDRAALAEDLAHVEDSIQICRRIFGGMLSIARGSGRAIGHGNLRRAIDGAQAVLGDSFKRREILVEVDIPDELPLVRGGQNDLTQVVLNLCTNARDAMTAGGRLAIRARPSNGTVRLEIADTGTGIPPEVLARVWEPFFSTKADGNGLGLSICRSILRELGGALDIASSPGAGTTVTLTVPVLETPPPAREGPQ
jgi:signal transduction histidine kinase